MARASGSGGRRGRWWHGVLPALAVTLVLVEICWLVIALA